MPVIPMEKEQLEKLSAFVALCQADPQILHKPELLFFKKFIESFGGVIPPAKSESPPPASPTAPPVPEPNLSSPEEEMKVESDSEPESDLELDNTGVIEPDTDEPQPMGDTNKVPSEEDMEQANEKRGEAMMAFADGDFEKASKVYTEAILLNPGQAALYAKRGQAYLKMQKPNACIRDCDVAIKLNPDSAPGHKFRGQSYRLLGQWEAAARDLQVACRLDYDEQTNEWLKEIQPNAKKIAQHKRNHERRREEKELKERQEKVRRAKEAQKKAAEEEYKRRQESGPQGFPGFPGAGAGFPGAGSGFPGAGAGFPGAGAGFPGAGFPPGAGAGFPGAASGGGMPGMGGLSDLFKDPELLEAFKDPEVSAAFQDVASNPANMSKYQNNPKIMSVINKLTATFGGGSGDDSPPAGFRFPGGSTGTSSTTDDKPSAPKFGDNVDLD